MGLETNNNNHPISWFSKSLFPLKAALYRTVKTTHEFLLSCSSGSPTAQLWVPKQQKHPSSAIGYSTFWVLIFWKDIIFLVTSKVWDHNPPLLVPPKAGGAENSRGKTRSGPVSFIMIRLPSIDVGILNNQRDGWCHLWTVRCACTKRLKFYVLYILLVGECAQYTGSAMKHWSVHPRNRSVIDTDAKQNWRRYTSYETWLIIVCVCCVRFQRVHFRT